MLIVTPAYAQTPGQGGGDLFGHLAAFHTDFRHNVFPDHPPAASASEGSISDMVSAALRRGDTVVTSGACLIGKVTKVIDDNEIQVEIADDVRVSKSWSRNDHFRCAHQG